MTLLDPLAAAGTSEGARKAWESRQRTKATTAPAPKPDLSSPSGVRKAFTLHGTLYDTEVIEAKDTNYDDADDGTAQIVRVRLVDKTGNAMGEAVRTVATVDGETEVYHDEFELGTQYQRHGVGSEFLRDSVAMYDAAGVDHVAVLAGSNAWSNGAYTWARLGFQLNPQWRDPFVSKMTTQMENTAFPLEDRPAWRDLAEKVSTGKATIQDVLDAPHGKDFLLGKFGTLTWHGILPVSKQAKYALAASAESTGDIDYDEWAEVEQGLDPWDDDTLTADAGELVDDETERQATTAVRAAYRAAIDLVGPRVLARIESARATNRALVAAGDGDNDQIITDDEWAAIASEHVDDTIGDGILDGVVAGATQFLKLASESAVAKAFGAAAASFAGFANELRSKLDTWIGNKIGQGITGDWGIGRVLEELGLSSPLSPDKADLVAGTETQAAVNAGTFAALQVAPPAALRWVTERDERVRPTHVTADTDTVPFGELFTVGGSPARFPGDPNLPAKERFNCRCHLAYVDGTEARRVVGATKAELRAKASALSVSGRSTMNKGQLQSAVLNELCLQGMAGGPDCPDVLDKWNRTALLSAARGEGIVGRHRMSREELIYQLRTSMRGGNTAMVAKGYSTSQELARAQKKAVYKRGRAKPGEFASSTVPSPDARRASRHTLFDEFGGVEAGSVPCVHCGLRLAPDAGSGLAVLVPEPIVPWSQGGSLALSNLVPSCPACFRARGGLGLLAAGTPEGAVKAWESRHRETLSFDDEDAVRDAFTLHGKTYDAEAGNIDVIQAGTDEVYEVSVYLKDKTGKQIGIAQRVISNYGEEVEHSAMVLNEDAQGKGVGAEFLRDSVEMYKRAGVQRVTVDATSDHNYGNGAYSWARVGFTPTAKSRQELASDYRAAAGQHQKPPLDDDALTARLRYADSFAAGSVSIRDLAADPIGKKMLLGDYGDIDWQGYIDVAKGLAADAALTTDDIDYDLWARTELDASGAVAADARTPVREFIPGRTGFAGTRAGAVKAWESRDRAEPATAEEFGKQVPAKRTSRPAEWFASKAELAATRELIAQKIHDLPKPTRAEIAKNRRMLRRAETHGRAGGELRGNSMTRRARGEALFAEFGGDKKGYCPCGYCGLKVSPRGRGGFAAMQQDKILTAAEGGKYGTPTSFPNLIPSCAGCNASRNDEPYHIRPEWDLPLAASADIGHADGATVVAFPLGWDDPEVDTVGRPIQGILEHRTVGPDGHQYVQWLCGGEVIDPDTIMTVNDDGTLTAAGTSEGAKKAWESRDHGAGGDLHAAVAAVEEFDQDAEEDRQRAFEDGYRKTINGPMDDFVGDYLDWAYQDINKALRDGGPAEDWITESIAGMDKTIAEHGSGAPAGLLRGKGEGSRLAELGWEVGHEFTEKGYGSWTPKADVALHFAKTVNGKGSVVMRLTNSAGIRSIPGKEAEYESILPRGMTYKVTGITDFVGPDGTKQRLMDVEAVNALTAAGTSEGAIKAWQSRQRAATVSDVVRGDRPMTPLEHALTDPSPAVLDALDQYGAAYDAHDALDPWRPGMTDESRKAERSEFDATNMAMNDSIYNVRDVLRADYPDMSAEEISSLYSATINRYDTAANLAKAVAAHAAAASMTEADYTAAVTAKIAAAFDGPILVRVGPKALEHIINDGRMLTQFESGHSGGLYKPEARARREFSAFGLDPTITPGGSAWVDGEWKHTTEHWTTSEAVRPIYGYVATGGVRASSPKTGDLIDTRTSPDVDGLSQYGKIQIELKPAVRSRTTATIGDSLDGRVSGRPVPIDHPTIAGSQLLAPGQGGMVNAFLNKDPLTVDYGSEEWRKRNYVEAQIHQGVTLDDIAKVYLPAKTGTLTSLLDAHSIPWEVIKPKPYDLPLAAAATPGQGLAVNEDGAVLRDAGTDPVLGQLGVVDVDGDVSPVHTLASILARGAWYENALEGLTAAGTSEGARKAWESRQRSKQPADSSPAGGLGQYTVDASVPPRHTRAGYGLGYVDSKGFPPLSEFYDETLAKRGEGFTEASVAELKERMATDPIAVRMNLKGINGLVADGRFKTIAETKSSRGKGRYAEYRQARQTYESSKLGVDLEQKDKTPVYGYLAHGDESAWAIDGYGTFEVRLKDQVKNRASITEGDSLNGLRPVAFGEAANATDSDWWQAHEAGAREFALAKGKVPKDVKYNGTALGSTVTFKPIYTEAQVYGGVSLSDVSEVLVHHDAQLPAKTRAGLIAAGVKVTEAAPTIVPGYHYENGEWLADPETKARIDKTLAKVGIKP